jgi:hypothetical protein
MDGTPLITLDLLHLQRMRLSRCGAVSSQLIAQTHIPSGSFL